MSRKDYIAIAEIIAGDYATCGTSEERYKVRGVVFSLAHFFRKDNEQFNCERFYNACGIPRYGKL